MVNFIVAYISIYLFLIFFNIFFRPIQNFIIFCLIIFLSYFGFNNIEILSLDYYNYLSIFQTAKILTWSELFSVGDPLFLILVKIIDLLVNNTVSIFLFLIFLSLLLKFYIAVKFIPVRLIPIFLFLILGRFYFLHDLTQLRASLAISLGTISLLILYRNNLKINSKILFLYILGCLFHISLLIIIPLYFIVKRVVNTRNFPILYFFIFILLSVGIGTIFSNSLSSIIASMNFIDRISLYFSDQGESQNIRYSVFQFYFLMKFTILIYLTNVYSRFNNFNKALVVTYVYAMCLQALFMFSSAIGLRFSAIFGYIDMMALLIPLSNYIYKKYFNIYFVIISLIALVFFYSSLLTIGMELNDGL